MPNSSGSWAPSPYIGGGRITPLQSQYLGDPKNTDEKMGFPFRTLVHNPFNTENLEGQKKIEQLQIFVGDNQEKANKNANSNNYQGKDVDAVSVDAAEGDSVLRREGNTLIYAKIYFCQSK